MTQAEDAREPTAEVESLRLALAEAREQQTATAEILQIISRSPTDVQPMLDAVTRTAARLCGPDDAYIVQDGGELRMTSTHGSHMAMALGGTLPIDRSTVNGRAFIDRTGSTFTVRLPAVVPSGAGVLDSV